MYYYMDIDIKKIIDESIDQILSEGKDYIGCITTDDNVEGQRVYSCHQLAHNKNGFNSRRRWKYDGDSNKVIWSIEFTDHDKERLNQWLAATGRDIKNPIHVTHDQFYKNWNVKESNCKILQNPNFPLSGEAKYCEQLPGGQMLGVNLEESNFRIYNDSMCPELWDQYFHLDGNIRINLLRMAYDFYEKSELPAKLIDVYLMGSISNYNWNKDSDIDVHVMIDYDTLQMPKDAAMTDIKTLSSNWNSEHHVIIKGHKVEMNFQNIKEEKPHVTGIYSLVKDQWVRKPTKQNVKIDKAAIIAKFSEMQKYIQDGINSGNRELMKEVKKKVDAFRQYGLDSVGEMSPENLVFKLLRSKGIIKKLKDSIIKTYDKEMSIDEVGRKDLRQNMPRDYFGGFDFDKLTLDNLNSLYAKALRFVKYDKLHNDISGIENWSRKAEILNNEIQRRLNAINKTVAVKNVNVEMSLNERELEQDLNGNVKYPSNYIDPTIGYKLKAYSIRDPLTSIDDKWDGKSSCVWMWDGIKLHIKNAIGHETAFAGQSHHIRGIYQSHDRIVYVIIPYSLHIEDPSENDIPNALLKRLYNMFGPNSKIDVFTGEEKKVQEGYGMGDPTKDPIATGRWTVKMSDTPKNKDFTDLAKKVVDEYFINIKF